MIKDHVVHIHVCGTGEPFLNKDIFKIFRYLHSVGHQPSILTNGTSVVSDKLEQIIEAGLKHYNTDLDTI